MEYPSQSGHLTEQHVKRSSDVEYLLKTVFGHSTFRPHQETVCRAAAEGQDLLLVMPTGAGKSLCFQVPGLARGGTTLVISPLIALMEDQVAKLQVLGLRADRIHAGRNADACRQAFAAYHQGRLDFLFVAPERVSSQGFFEMISEKKPTLIAIDEAHCISQWGHDFRPEYRMLGQRLQALRPIPIIALTATATAQVQDDIIQQLGIPSAKRFIHGFRRSNIAIEVREIGPGDRLEIARTILSNPAALPAIIYAPTRKHTERYATELSQSLSAAPYHAGMSAEDREQIQSAFIRGELQIVVATVAFGMGIDKSDIRTVVHMALPSTVESYYQEIGRAGRDGKPSRAILMHSFIDRRTHEFLFEKNYPQIKVLQQAFRHLFVERSTTRNQLIGILRQDEEVVTSILDKLWIHGGAELDAEGQAFRGKNDWESSYLKQRKLRALQLLQVAQFAEAKVCRMKLLVEHFDDRDESDKGCGQCDICRPGGIIVINTEDMPSNRDFDRRLLEALSATNKQAAGKLFRECFEPIGVDRSQFEHRLELLARRKIVKFNVSNFYKDGRWIEVRKLELTPIGSKILRARSNEKVAVPAQPLSSHLIPPKQEQRPITKLLLEISSNEMPIKEGSQVKHRAFGTGKVEQVIEEFGVKKAIVDFSQVGIRKLAVKSLVL
jgi:DNA topoisomerase-3